MTSNLLIHFNRPLKQKFNFIYLTICESLNNEENLPEQLKKIIILAEDHRFYNHQGVDIYSIIRAFYKNTFTNRFEGASTITQQLVRNIINQREITFNRKIKEVLFSVLIENRFNKEQIIYSYCKTYSFGEKIGIFELCEKEKYNIKNLNIKEGAEIASRLKYPILNSYNYNKYLKRVRTIERKMLIPLKSDCNLITHVNIIT